GLPIYRDRYVGKGPLAGLETALFHVEADVFVVAACDMPFIHTSIYHCLLQQRADYDAVIPVYNGQIHPLAGIYKKEVLPVIKKMLDADERKVKSLSDHVHVKYVATFPGIPEEVLYKHFFNMNTPAQYEKQKAFYCETKDSRVKLNLNTIVIFHYFHTSKKVCTWHILFFQV